MENATATTPSRVPLFGQVDLLIFGAPTGSVAAALSARAAGASVIAVSDRSWFGEENAGSLRLSREPLPGENPIAERLRQVGDPAQPYTPGAIKRVLDRALLDAEVPFYFNARPVSILRDDQGAFAGVVFASRTALFAIGARAVIDTSRYGLVARMAGVPSRSRGDSPLAISQVVLSVEAPPSGSIPWTTLGNEFHFAVRSKEFTLRDYAAQVTLAAPQSLAERASLDFRVRSQTAFAGMRCAPESLGFVPDEVLGDGGGVETATPDEIAAEHLRVSPGIWLSSPSLPLSVESAMGLWTTPGQLCLGSRVGSLAVSEIDRMAAQPQLEKTDGPASERGILFAETLVRPSQHSGWVAVSLPVPEPMESVDVVVAGGGTAGASAGISAARAGARTVVLENLHGLGGVGTMGLIARYYFGNRVGFTQEIDEGVLALAGPDHVEGRAHGWNPEDKSQWLQSALAAAGGSAWYASFVCGVVREDRRISGVLVSTPYGTGLVRCATVVDATGNADLAAAAGVPCRVIDWRHVGVQGTGLSHRNPAADYQNTDHTFVDDTDITGVTHAFVNARAKFTEAFDTSPLVDSRERRQIHGEIELSPLDFLAGRTFPDTIGTASSNFDTHGFTVHPVFLVMPPDKKELRAHVPFRCMMPRELDNLLVTGLGMSAHRDALPVIRMQPDVQNQGYAAGMACALISRDGRGLRELDMRDLQSRLLEVGNLEAEVLRHEDSFPLSEEQVRAACQRGPVDLLTCATIVAHRDVAEPILREQLAGGREDPLACGAALILGLFGDSEAAPLLAELVDTEAWDKGWNYRGMGQFGMSMSRIDAYLVALGKTRSPRGHDPILAKMRELNEESEFSHCRAVSIAASAIPSPEFSAELTRLLSLPGVSGHAHIQTAAVLAAVNEQPNETEARNLSLRELLLARGLYLTGDPDGLGKRILQTYENDLRGHYARHAQAILAVQDLDSIRGEVL